MKTKRESIPLESRPCKAILYRRQKKGKGRRKKWIEERKERR